MSPFPQSRDLALIGAGSWGKNLARCFDRHGALRAIVVPSDEVPALQGDYQHVAFTGSVGDVLSDPAIKKVAIATPSSSHFELAQAALQAGKDVFVEKPLCLRASDAQALADLADGSGRTLMVGHLLQYHPCVVELRKLVASGVLGKLLTVTANRLNLGKFRTDENALYSFAPHDVSVLLAMLGDALPTSVRCVGASFVRDGIADSTTTLLKFGNGVLAQLYVSWLNPFKEQKLTVVGTRGMAVFDDTKPWDQKLVLYQDYMARSAEQGADAARASGEARAVPEAEPLLLECEHFLRACETKTRPRTDGHEGARVLRVLDMAQRSLEQDGERVVSASGHDERDYFAHPSAVIDEGARIGASTKLWHFTHVMAGARIGQRCNLGQNVFVADGARLGDDVKVQNNVSVYDGVELEAQVFVGPSCVFTNVKRPRSELDRRGRYERTLVRRGATLGASSTIVCGVTLGRYCFIAAGAVVTKDVPDYALMAGNPARRIAWVGRLGCRLVPDDDGALRCPESGLRYRELAAHQLICLDDSDAAEP